jgi:hypothetical protein
LSGGWAEEWFAVVDAEQEGEAVQVGAQLGGAAGGVTGEIFQRCGEAAGVAGQPIFEEVQELDEFGSHRHDPASVTRVAARRSSRSASSAQAPTRSVKPCRTAGRRAFSLNFSIIQRDAVHSRSPIPTATRMRA